MEETPRDKDINRRRMLRIMAAGGVGALTIALPSKWTRPIVESIIVPAHAAASPTGTTGTGTSGTGTSGTGTLGTGTSGTGHPPLPAPTTAAPPLPRRPLLGPS